MAKLPIARRDVLEFGKKKVWLLPEWTHQHDLSLHQQFAISFARAIYLCSKTNTYVYGCCFANQLNASVQYNNWKDVPVEKFANINS